MADQGFGAGLLERFFGPRGSGISMQTARALNQEDLDLVDPKTGKLAPGGRLDAPTAPAPAPAGGSVAPANTGLSKRRTAQEAAAAGDPQLLELLRRRQQGLGAKPTPPKLQ